jgi:CheY-like chemotaxis protein
LAESPAKTPFPGPASDLRPIFKTAIRVQAVSTFPAMTTESSPKTLLVIEDQATLRANLALLLELEGYRVLTAADGRQGLESARQEQPDLILCDQMMPVLDGRGVVSALRKDRAFDRTPFLFLSAFGESADLEEARQLGADAYLTKPVVREDLVKAVRTWLATGRQGLSSRDEPQPAEPAAKPVAGGLRESLAVLLTGTEILHHHGESLSEAERLSQRDAMLAAIDRLAIALKEKGESPAAADF